MKLEWPYWCITQYSQGIPNPIAWNVQESKNRYWIGTEPLKDAYNFRPRLSMDHAFSNKDAHSILSANVGPNIRNQFYCNSWSKCIQKRTECQHLYPYNSNAADRFLNIDMRGPQVIQKIIEQC